MIPAHRGDDAVITVCQNNGDKSIEITEINKEAEQMLGLTQKKLKGKALGKILPTRIGEMLEEYVEFEDGANDVGSVLSRVQTFSVIGGDGKETSYKLKVVRADSKNDKIFFKLVLHDKTGIKKNEAVRKVIQDNFKGHESLDPETGLPDKNSLLKDIELMGYYNNKGDVKSSFAIIQIDHYDELFSQYGRTTCHGLLKHASQICRQSLRPDDVVGTISNKRVGVLLMDTSTEAARMTFNRLRWQIAANPFILPDRSSVGLSVSITFSRVGGRLSDKNVMETCIDALDELGAGAVNVLSDVEEIHKRG